MRTVLSALLAAAVWAGASTDAEASRCLFISSYHQGYEWSDGVERGLRSVLEGRCEIRQFDMDTKRNKGEAYKQRMGLAAKRLIETWSPDVVITADDNAAKYVIQPYFKDASTPFVFGGVNWTTREYGFPYRNVTGMVEVAPIRPMLRQARSISGGGSAFYLGAETLTEEKNVARFQSAAKNLGMTLDHRLVGTADEWLDAYRDAQSSSDIVVMGSHSGIVDWAENAERIRSEVARTGRRLSVTNHGWMMPFTMFGMTMVPEEHGEWTAKAALAILEGTPPAEIPIVANRKWDLWINPGLLTAAEVELPSTLKRKAKSYR